MVRYCEALEHERYQMRKEKINDKIKNQDKSIENLSFERTDFYEIQRNFFAFIREWK